MKRAFLSLYLLLVLAILGLGWTLDQLWSAYQSEHPSTPPGAVLSETLQLAATNRPLEQTRELIHQLASQGLADVRLVPLETISGDPIKERLQTGEYLSFEDDDGNLYHYRKLLNAPQVIVISEVTTESSRRLEALLGLLFYGALAAVIFFWLWPLSRDLDVLANHAEELGRNPEAPLVSLSGYSAARRLGQTFNRMAERVRGLLRSQREMTHAVSHELRTPLARMKFALEMAEASRDPDNLHSKLQSLKADVTEMDQLVTQLLNYARYDQEPTLYFTSGDMPGLVKDLWERLTDHQPHPPALHLHMSAIGEPVVCDWPLMERVLHNLLQNALRYTRTRIDVTLHAANGEFVLSVEDDGPGIPPEDRHRVFESFVRLREDPEHQTAGFGLGLAIVQRVMQWHRGRVEVGSSPQGGARFTLRWAAKSG